MNIETHEQQDSSLYMVLKRMLPAADDQDVTAFLQLLERATTLSRRAYDSSLSAAQGHALRQDYRRIMGL